MTKNVRKRSRRRLRLDRLAIVLAAPLLLAAATVWLVRTGTQGATEKEYTPEAQTVETVPSEAKTNAEEAIAEQQESRQIISPEEAGRRDAAEALRYPPESMARQNVLLRIHAREWELRESGYPHSADTYITTVRQQLGNKQ